MHKILRQLAVICMAMASPLVLAEAIFKYGGHTYKIISEPASWADASSAAVAMQLGGKQGYLARVNSASENTAILEAVTAHLTEEELAASLAQDGSDTPFIWLGGSDNSVEGRWICSDNGDQFWQGDFNGNPVNGLFTNWGIQPDSATGDEDALAMGLADWPEPFFDLGTAGQWNDLNGNTPLVYVVEFSGLSDIRLEIDEPTPGGVHTGIGNVRGWAISSNHIERVEIFIDGAYQFDIPHGGSRGDVGNAFPKIENSALSGYAAAVNYNNLSPGEHELVVRASDTFGSTIERQVTFEVIRFEESFISASDDFELGWAGLAALGRTITIYGAMIGEHRYNLTLQWRASTQGFEIIRIQKLEYQ
ncbi:MAG: C-type lectin domain-containing protein [Halieaceae bacterium]